MANRRPAAKVALFYHPGFLEHDTGRHIECGARLTALLTHLAARGLLAGVSEIRPEPAAVEDIARIHAVEYIEAIRNVAEAGGAWADPDTYISEGSYSAALLAAGAAIGAAEAVAEGRYEKSFALVRPPGHHAGRLAARGFCIFNNTAMAASALLARDLVKRVAILDFDVHHGNGTQEAFYGDDRVLFVSFHRYPFYPGTGGERERGAGRGEGLTVNVPLSIRTTPREYLALWEEILESKVKSFAPEIVLVSAGFDLYRGDPVAGLNFDVADFEVLGRLTREGAEAICRGRVATVLEGGYDLEMLPLCFEAYARGLGAFGRR
ncbi:MAG: histone deacetylase family protein [Planctomycetota bacterium]